MPGWHSVRFLDVPPGSGWRRTSWIEGTCNDAFYHMAKMVHEGGDPTDPPSGVLIQGPDFTEHFTWGEALGAAYINPST